MIYRKWEDETNEVVNGFDPDSCSLSGNYTNFVDSNVDLGSASLGETSTPRVLYLSIMKFDGTPPTRPVTGVKFFLTSYYEGTRTVNIPTAYSDEWKFCETPPSTTKTFGGYSGSASPSDDLNEIQTVWPANGGGFQICVDKCTWQTFSTTVGNESDPSSYILLDSRAGGSDVDGQLEYGRRAEIRLRYKVPSSISTSRGETAGLRQVLVGVQYVVSE